MYSRRFSLEIRTRITDFSFFDKMKILTKEEEEAHYNATVKGGTIGGLIGLGIGFAGVAAANARFHTIRNLTLPMKAFLVTSTATFAAIINADRSSRGFESSRHQKYQDSASKDYELAESNKTTYQRLKDWGRANRYSIVTGSWGASMLTAFALVGRNPYLTKQQKLVQARVYAQGLTLMVLVATAAFEIGDANKGKGRWETVKILDPNDPTHKHIIEKRIHHEAYAGEDLWRGMLLLRAIRHVTFANIKLDMVEAEEQKMKQRQAAVEERKRNGNGNGNGDHSDDHKDEHKTDSKKKN